MYSIPVWRGPRGAMEPEDRTRIDAAIETAETINARIGEATEARDTAVAAAAATDADAQATEAGRQQAVQAAGDAAAARQAAEQARLEAVAAINSLDFVTPQQFGASADGIGDDTTAFNQAIATGKIVSLRAGVYRLTGPLILQSGSTLIADTGSVEIRAENPVIFTATALSDVTIQGINWVSRHISTGYNFSLTDCQRFVLVGALRMGNSGVHMTGCSDCRIDLDMREIRGTGIRLTGSSRNYVTLRRGRNIGGFGIYLAMNGTVPSSYNTIRAEKFVDPDNLTAYQLEGANVSGNYDPATGQLGLEGIGITKGNDSNVIVEAKIRHTKDNGVSITSDYNTATALIVSDCDHDGLHIYGGWNAVAGVTAVRNRFSGIGIGRSETQGSEVYNSVTGVVSDANMQYGVRFVSDANGNMVSGVVGSLNNLGPSSYDATGINTFSQAGGAPTTEVAAQVTFATVGDLSIAYAERAAWFRTSDNWCDFFVRLRFTVTYTTASGEIRITVPGIPQGRNTPPFLVGEVSNSVLWPSGATQLHGRFESGSVMRLRGIGNGIAPVNLTAANFPSGVQHTLSVAGRYRIS